MSITGLKNACKAVYGFVVFLRIWLVLKTISVLDVVAMIIGFRVTEFQEMLHVAWWWRTATFMLVYWAVGVLLKAAIGCNNKVSNP